MSTRKFERLRVLTSALCIGVFSAVGGALAEAPVAWWAFDSAAGAVGCAVARR